MNRSTIVAAVLTSSLIAIAAIAQTNMPGFPLNSETAHSAAYMEFDRLVGVMSQVVDPVRDAYYVASQGCNASTIEGMDLSAHMVLNMLEGPGSSLFDVTLDIPLVSGNGIIPIVNAFTLTEGWYDPEETAVQQKDTLEGTLERFQKSFDTLSQYVQSALEQGITSSEKRSRMIVVCSSLDAKRLQIEGYLATFGYEIRLSPLDSAQQAIDGARDGATVYLWPRTYTESLEISKNITLVGASVGSPLFQTARVVYETTIAPETPDDDGIRIHADHPVQVTIRQLTVKNASEAIVAEGQVLVTLDQVSVIDSDVGVAGYDLAQITISDSMIEHNGTALRLDDGSSMTMANSDVLRSTGLEGAIQLNDSSAMDLVNTSVLEGGGHGIVVRDDARAALTNCLVGSNDGDGMRLFGNSWLVMNQTSCSDNAGLGIHAMTGECQSETVLASDLFNGVVLGTGNFYPGLTGPSGNRLGGICPIDLFD